MTIASVLVPTATTYKGAITTPDRWSTWSPRAGDVLVCTPPKCGTTWTQTILMMLIYGTGSLPAPIPEMSPWIDADLGIPEAKIKETLDCQSGRRVLKTHTPADGFPVWDGVTVIAIYRHPLDVFFSLRKHQANVREQDPNEPMCWPLDEAFSFFIEEDTDASDFDRDKLASIALHYTKTALDDRVPGLTPLHYADMRRNGRGAVKSLARLAGIETSEGVIDIVTAASSFSAMKKNAEHFAPVGGTGYWKSDAGFFDSGSSRKWDGVLSMAQVQAYHNRLAMLVPDAGARDWLENGAVGDAAQS